VRWLSLAGGRGRFPRHDPALHRLRPGPGRHAVRRKAPWITRFNVQYLLGVDGISMPFILLNSLITVLVVLAGWEVIEDKQAQYMGAFLIMSGLMNGIFSALDGVLFYVFFEASLIPMYIIIGVWGGPNRVYAAFKFFLYTLLGSLLMLVALIWLFLESGGSFNILDWHQMRIALAPQILIFIAFLVSFAVKVPMWPVHTWLPDAHVEAPTGGSVVLAAIALKLGAYGFVRFSLPIVPGCQHLLAPFIIALSLIAVVYIGFVALVQTDMKKLIAYSSISHMGFVTLGFFIFNGQRDRRRRRAGADDLARLRLRRHVPLRRRHVRPHAFAPDRRLRRRGEHHAEVRRAVRVLRHGQLRPAGHLGLRRRVHGHPRRRQVQFLDRLRRRHHADPRRRLHAVDGQARGLRRRRQRPCRRTEDIGGREFLVLGLLAVCVLAMGLYPFPFTEVMHASVDNLLKHVAMSKLSDERAKTPLRGQATRKTREKRC
jgi:NADH-quinone oxidoreductase subunit M